jgi:hypothetical protein
MPVWRALLASCLGALALLPADAARADTALAALDLQQPATERLEPELDCLALNIYWEARSEPLLGQVAVAAVTLNRVAAPAFPDTVCAVVFQGEERGRHLCQFSWRCDGRADQPRNLVAWAEARRIARLALSDQVTDPTGGALWYHAAHVLPAWTRTMTLRTRIGHHLFYGRAASEAQEPRAGGIAGSSAQPGPMTALAAAGQDLLELLSGDLRIDVEHDPAGELLLCDDVTLCGTALTQVQMRGTNATMPPAADRRVPELRLSAENAPPAPARKRPSTPVS